MSLIKGEQEIVKKGIAELLFLTFLWKFQARLLGSLEGHTKRCTGVAFINPELIVSSSADKTARVWRSGSGGDVAAWQCASVLRDHAAEVVGVTVHPSRRYFVTGSSDSSWAFYDVETITCLRQVLAFAWSCLTCRKDLDGQTQMEQGRMHTHVHRFIASIPCLHTVIYVCALPSGSRFLVDTCALRQGCPVQIPLQ